MRAKVLLFALTFCIGLVNAQDDINLNFVSNLDYSEECNDIWGFVASDGTEYAILGTTRATAVISLEDPANPLEVAYIAGSQSIWRDMKAWGDYVYVTADSGNDGLLVIDMSGAPDNITSEYLKPTVSINGNTSTINTCHNIYIDENGFAYLSGCGNINSGGVLIFDVHTTPGTPFHVGQGRAVYSHDNFVRGDTLWSSDISAGHFSVQDISDKNSSSTWATQTTTTVFTHNAWLSDDGKYLFTTDEKPNAFVDAYDVSDLDDIKLLDSYQPKATAGNGVIPHNTHYKDGYLITSWYTDGVVVFDAHKPDNLVQVAAYDTYPGADGGFSGCWGAYPWLPSGLILASDINTGLYVLAPDYQRAAYLEGKVTNASGGAIINGASVTVTGFTETQTMTNFTGDYKTGYAKAGTYMVQFFKSGFLPAEVETTLVNGQVTTLDVQLTEAIPFHLDIKLVNANTGDPIEGSVILVNNFERFDANTNSDGAGAVDNIVEGGYAVYAGAWGFLHTAENMAIDAATGEITLELTPGYQDDFLFDLGWEPVNGGATTGDWVRGVPIPTSTSDGFSNVNEDIKTDLGDECYMTGNSSNGGVGGADVDGGAVILYSPVMDLSTYIDPVVSFYTWFYNGGGSGTPNDSMTISINNGTDEVVLETIKQSGNDWRLQSEFKVSDYLEPTDNVRLIFVATDEDPGHLVEGGVDAFLVTEGGSVSTNNIELAATLEAFPNPFQENFSLNYQLEDQLANGRIVVYNALGQEVLAQDIQSKNGNLELGASFEKGVYFVLIASGDEQSQVLKLIKE